MKIDYRAKFKAQLQENILKVRDEIDNTDFIVKITNHADKYERDFNEVRDKILNDDLFAEVFAKDPAKQNIYEKLAAEYIDSIECVNDFKNLANGSKMFAINGEITNQRLNDVKSIDFTFNLIIDEIKYNFYCSHKYIKALCGGAQDNQYNDIRNFLRNCDKKSEGNSYFIAICDGPYFTSKIKTLNNEFGSNNVITLTIDEFEDCLLNIIKEKTLS